MPIANSAETPALPDIGELYEVDKNSEIAVPFMVWSQFYCVQKIHIDHIDYQLYIACGGTTAKEEKQRQKIAFIESSDPNFSTPEGLSIGDKFNNDIGSSSYGGECKMLPSGWHACVKIVNKNGVPGYESTISRFIK